MMRFILGGQSVTVMIDNMPHTISKTAANFKAVMDAISNNDEDELRKAVKLKEMLKNTIGKYVTIDSVSNKVMYKDREITGIVCSRLFEMMEYGIDVSSFVLFIENLMQNPSSTAVNELFEFLDACQLPITEDGHFLAYKKVRENYKDVHSGQFDNSVGQILEMPRNQVDDNRNNTCSAGFHFCSLEYLRSFGGQRIMVVKINPADVVAIPTDYNFSKGRAWRYEVIDEITTLDSRTPEVKLNTAYVAENSANIYRDAQGRFVPKPKPYNDKWVDFNQPTGDLDNDDDWV